MESHGVANIALAGKMTNFDPVIRTGANIGSYNVTTKKSHHSKEGRAYEVRQRLLEETNRRLDLLLQEINDARGEIERLTHLKEMRQKVSQKSGKDEYGEPLPADFDESFNAATLLAQQ